MEEKFGPTHSDTQQYSETTSKLHPKHINTRHRKLMRLLIAGWTLRDAAEMLGYHPKRVSQIVTSPLFKEEMAKMQEEIKKEFVETEGSKATSDIVRLRMKEEALASLETLIKLRDSSQSDRVRQLSAIEILDRAGYKPTDKVEAEIAIDASDGLCQAIATVMKEMREKKDGGSNQKAD